MLKTIFLLAEYGEMSEFELRKFLGINSYEELKRVLSPLIQLGLVEPTWRRAYTRWRHKWPRRPKRIYRLTEKGLMAYESICALRRLGEACVKKDRFR